jgi:hypothetical protein
MVTLAALWVPIAVAAVLVFVTSAIVHIVLRYHASDYRALPRESETMADLRRAGLTPGMYMFPHAADPKQMSSPEIKAKYEAGPVGHLTVFPSSVPQLGKHLAQWFVFCVAVGVFTAYVAGHTLAPGTHYLEVFRVVGAVSFMAYGVGRVTDSIWMGHPWGATVKQVVDGLLYALVTAGAFGWLWPR